MKKANEYNFDQINSKLKALEKNLQKEKESDSSSSLDKTSGDEQIV